MPPKSAGMLSVYGSAARYAHRFPPDLNAIACDASQSSVELAYRDAVRRRNSGEPFYGILISEQWAVHRANQLTPMLLTQSTDYDQQASILEQLATGQLQINGASSHEYLYDAGAMSPNWGEFLALCDEVLVRSFAQAASFVTHPQLVQKRMRRLVLEARVPVFARVRPTRPSVVVWAGDAPVETTRIALFGLKEFRGDVAYVAHAPLPEDPGVAYYRPDDPAVAHLLARSPAVICTDPDDPGDAIAFARSGIGIVAPFTAGAFEYVVGAVTWDGLNPRSLYDKVAIAIARDTELETASFAIPLAPRRPVLPPLDELPLVTILTSTLNRREEIRRMLTCLAAQTYPRIESIVVNDGGTPVDDIVAEFPFARTINLERNGGVIAGFRAGLEVARGDYIGLLPDDDWLYPAHVELLMAAILRSGAKIAHGTGLVRYLRRRDDGATETIGFNAFYYRETVSPSNALIGTPVAGHQCLQARETFAADDVGWYLGDYQAADVEYHMRLVERYQWAFVTQCTTEFRDHAGNTGKSLDWAVELAKVYDEAFPVVDRPLIVARRQAIIQQLRAIPSGQNVHQPLLTLTTPE